MSEKDKNANDAGPDRLTEILKLWASRYSQPIEHLSADRLVSLIEEFLSEKPKVKKKGHKAGRRWDHEVIKEIITPGARVLDLGCGSGELLERLIRLKGVRGQGIEIYNREDCLAAFPCSRRTWIRGSPAGLTILSIS